jgi:hypothetical protein
MRGLGLAPPSVNIRHALPLLIKAGATGGRVCVVPVGAIHLLRCSRSCAVAADAVFWKYAS